MDVKRTCLKVWPVPVCLLCLIILTTSFVSWLIPATAVEASWSVVAAPGSTGGNDLIDTIQTTDIAIGNDGYTIYVTLKGVWGVTPDYHSRFLLKSTDGGMTGADLTYSLPDTIINTDYIAVAPDDSNIVVVVDKTSFSASLSINGGITWLSLGLPPMTSINDVSISSIMPTRYVAVAGAADGAGAIYYFNLGAFTLSWRSALNPLIWTPPIPLPDAFWAVKFSPNFASDFIMLAVSASDTQGVQLHAASFNTAAWDSAIPGYLGYPATVASAAVPGDVTVTSADITLDPNYIGFDKSSRIAFIGLTATYSGINVSGICRMNDTLSSQVIVSPAAIDSIAFDGTTLVAGAYDTNTVYHSTSLQVLLPKVVLPAGDIAPGGERNTLVAFAGAKVIAATSGAGSGISRSTDGGVTFEMILPYILANPILEYPPTSTSGVAPRPKFSWQAVPYVSSYEFQLATDSAFTAPIISTNLSQTAYTLNFDLATDTTYFWRVRSLGGFFPSPWSASSVFIVNASPSPWPWPLAGGAAAGGAAVISGALLVKSQLAKKNIEKTNAKFKNGDVEIKVSNILGKPQIKSDTPLQADKAINLRLVQDPGKQSIKLKGKSLLDGKEDK